MAQLYDHHDNSLSCRGVGMKHRIAAVLSLAVALMTNLGWTAESCAQTKVARVGVLAHSETSAASPFFQGFEQALAGRGWLPGKTVVLEYRAPRADEPGFSMAAEDLVRLKVDVIFAPSAPALRAAYKATQIIPIVASDATTDPISAGYAQSYDHPGKNVTGVFLDAPAITSKWLDILKALKPGLSRVAVLWDPSPWAAHLTGIQAAASALGITLRVHEVRTPADIEEAFLSLRGRSQALVVLPSPLTYDKGPWLAELTLKHRVLGIGMFRNFTEAGGAVSYGPNLSAGIPQLAAQVAKILEGAEPGELPIEGSSRFDFLVNMKTVEALGLTVQGSLLLSAEQVNR